MQLRCLLTPWAIIRPEEDPDSNQGRFLCIVGLFLTRRAASASKPPHPSEILEPGPRLSY
jgi:hypothetical protein